MRSFEITYFVSGANALMQRTIVQASDPVMARRIFEQQNPQCRVAGTPREIR